jgi:hypothetical protein
VLLFVKAAIYSTTGTLTTTSVSSARTGRTRWELRDYLFAPKSLVLGPPLADVRKPLAFLECQGQVGVCQADDFDGDDLDHADRRAG